MTNVKRYALVSLVGTTPEQIARYLPANYELGGYALHDLWGDDDLLRLGPCALIEGRDNAGWTLDGYVIPRLASGLHWAREIDLSHPVMKLIRDEPS